MYEESILIKEEIKKTMEEYDFSHPILIHSNSRNTLYRFTRKGKFFMIKTGKDAFAHTLLAREYDLSLQLDHPYLVHILSYEEETPVGPGLVMEYIHGRTLTDFLSENPGIRQKQKILGQILEVTAYIHHSGIIHNDLKPDNILITYSGDNVKLIDFGLSDNDVHGLEQHLGYTRRYASPELKTRRTDIDSRSDLYSIGIIMEDLFRKRYFWISNRCTKNEVSRRFKDIGSLEKSWRKRNQPLHLLLVSLALLLILFPTILYYNEHMARVRLQQTIESEEHLADSLTHLISTRLETRYQSALDSISLTNDRAEQIRHLGKYLESTWILMDSLHRENPDTEIGARIDSWCNQVRNKHQDKILELLSD